MDRSSAARDLKSRLKEARRAVAENRLDEARRIVDTLTGQHVEDSTIQYALFEIAVASGDEVGSSAIGEESFEQLGVRELRRIIGHAYRNGHFELSEKLSRRAQRLYPESPVFRALRAKALYAQLKYEEALQFALEVLPKVDEDREQAELREIVLRSLGQLKRWDELRDAVRQLPIGLPPKLSLTAGRLAAKVGLIGLGSLHFAHTPEQQAVREKEEVARQCLLLEALLREEAPARTELQLPDAAVEAAIVSLLQSSVAYAPSNPKAIVFFVRKLTKGGAEQQVLNLLRQLLQVGYQLTVVYEDEPDDEAGRGYRERMRLLPLRLLPLAAGSEREIPEPLSRLEEMLPAWILRDAVPLYHILSEIRPAALHTWQDAINISGGIAALAAGVPRVVMSARNVSPVHPLRAKSGQSFFADCYRRFLSSSRFTLTHNSERGAEDYGRWLGTTRGFSALGNGIDFAEMEQEAANATAVSERFVTLPILGPLVVGTVIRFVDQKRPELFLAVAKYVLSRADNVQFVAVGSGPLLGPLERQVKEQGLSDKILFAGRSTAVAAWLALMDLFLLTSEIEGLPNVVIEALGFGVPVVSTNTGGVAELVRQGVTGWIDDPTALGERVLWCLEHEEWRRAASTAAREDIRSRYSLERLCAQAQNLYRSNTEPPGATEGGPREQVVSLEPSPIPARR
ncbi:MAG: glycosyltransferase [Bdellovibrionales bacterium]|nr:glycosyltransferase [Bdellovibrionales bacterium]